MNTEQDRIRSAHVMSQEGSTRDIFKQ